MMVKKAGLNETEAVLKKIPVEGKEVYFLPMRHLGKHDFYQNVRVLVDSLSRLGYAVYVETVKARKDGKAYVDTLALKKLRKIKNMDFSKPYIETNNSIIQNLIRKHELVGQPEYKDLGAYEYKIVDLSYVDLVQRFEALHGEVELDSCDLTTNFGQPYHCQTISGQKAKVFDKDFLFRERDKEVAKSIRNSTDKKILVVFGLLHYDGIIKELENLEKDLFKTSEKPIP